METRKIIKNDFELDYIQWMNIVRKEIDNQSDRGTIIIMCSILDMQLEKILKEYLYDSQKANKLFSNMGALSTFNNKIVMSYCLGLISEHEYNTMNIFRKIRNDFAHKIKIDNFSDDSSTKDKINNLSIPFGMYVPQEITFKGKEAQPFPIDVFEKSSLKDKLVLAFYYITQYLEHRPLYISKRKPFVAPTQSELLKNLLDTTDELAAREIELLEKEKELLKNDSFTYFQESLIISTKEFKEYLKSIQQAIEKSYSIDE